MKLQHVVAAALGSVCYAYGVWVLRNALNPTASDFHPTQVLEFVLVRSILGCIMYAMYAIGYLAWKRQIAPIPWFNVIQQSGVDAAAHACMLIGLVYLSDEDGSTVIYTYPMITLVLIRLQKTVLIPASTWIFALFGYASLASVAHRPELWIHGEHVPVMVGFCGAMLYAFRLSSATDGHLASHLGARQVASGLMCAAFALSVQTMEVSFTPAFSTAAVLHLMADGLCSMAWSTHQTYGSAHPLLLVLRFIEPALIVGALGEQHTRVHVCVLLTAVILSAVLTQMLPTPFTHLLRKHLLNVEPEAPHSTQFTKFSWSAVRFIWDEYGLLVRMIVIGFVEVAISTESPVYESRIIDYLAAITSKGNGSTEEAFDENAFWNVMTPFVAIQILSIVIHGTRLALIQIPTMWLLGKYKTTFVGRMLSLERHYQEEIDFKSETVGRQDETRYFLGPFGMTVDMLHAAVKVIRVCWIVFVFDWKLVFMMTATFPLEIMLEWALAKPIGEQTQLYQHDNVQYTNTVLDAVAHVRTIQRSDTLPKERRRFVQMWHAVVKRRVRIQIWQTSVAIAIAVASAAMTIFTWSYAARQIWLGYLTIGQVVAMSKYIPMLKHAGMRLATMYPSLIKWKAKVARVAHYNDHFDPVPTYEADQVITAHQIVLRDVSFTYPHSEAVLSYPNYTVDDGHTCAVVGPNGCGKSTLFALIQNEYSTDNGIIEIGGIDVRRLNTNTLVHVVAQVSPSSAGDWFESRSLGENLTYGLTVCPSDTQIQAACERMRFGTHDEDEPDWSKTASLSGGEIQRGLLVRAMLSPKPILLMDEPVAMLDDDGQRYFYENLKSLFPGRTILVVTHHMDSTPFFDHTLSLSSLGDSGSCSPPLGLHDDEPNPSP